MEIEEKNGTLTQVELLYKHYEFCLAYVRFKLNGKKAYLFVYPNAKPDSATAAASLLLTNINVSAVIKHLTNQAILKAEEVLFHLSDLTKVSAEPFMNYGKDGKQFPYIDLSMESAKEHMHFIKDIEMTRERRIEGKGEGLEEFEVEHIKLKFHDRKEALRDMARYHKLLTDRIEQSGYNIEIPWDELTPEQIARLYQGVDPAIIKKEIDEAKSSNAE